jgi:uncharacterized protein YxeA
MNQQWNWMALAQVAYEAYRQAFRNSKYVLSWDEVPQEVKAAWMEGIKEAISTYSAAVLA